MPDVHLRVVEDVLQRAQLELPVGVIEVADGEGEDVDDEEIVDAEADHRQGMYSSER